MLARRVLEQARLHNTLYRVALVQNMMCRRTMPIVKVSSILYHKHKHFVSHFLVVHMHLPLGLCSQSSLVVQCKWFGDN